MKGIIKSIIDHTKVDMFVLVFRGTDNRFESGMHRMLTTFQMLLGEKMYESLMIEFTFFRHDPRSVTLRKMANTSMAGLTRTWNAQLQLKLNVSTDLPAVFIDPMYLESIAQERETSLQEQQIAKFNSSFETMTPYMCGDQCLDQLHLWYEMRRPMIKTDSNVKAKRGEKIELECAIWQESFCSFVNTDTQLPLVWALEANNTIITLDENVTTYQMIDESDGHLPILRSILSFHLSEAQEGNYSCLFGNERTQPVSVSMVLGPKVG